MRALWKRKLWVLGLWLFVSVATVPLVRRLPVVYRAESVILIEGQRIPERYVAATVNDELHHRLSRLVQQIQSYENLVEMIERFNLYQEERKRLPQEEIVQQMRENIAVELVKGWDRTDAPAFTISYEASNPELAARVANEIRERFIMENLKIRGEQALGTSAFLESQLKAAREHLEQQEARLSEYKRQYTGELPEQANTLMAMLNRLQVQLQGVQEQVRHNHEEKAMLENALAAAESSLDAFRSMAERVRATERTVNAPGVSKVEEAEARLAALHLRYSEDHPDVRRAAAEAERQQSLARAARPEAPGEGDDSAAPVEVPLSTASVGPELAFVETLRRQSERVESLKAQSALNAENLKALDDSRNKVLAEIADVQRRVQNLPLREQEMAKEIRDYDISRANYQSLLNKRMDADVAAEMETRQKAERFTVLDVARVPEKPIKPQRELLVAAGCFAGLVLGMLLGFGIEMKSNVVLGEWELPPGTAVLGRISPISVSSSAATAPGEKGLARRGFSERKRFSILRLGSAWLHSLWLGLLAGLLVTSYYKGWELF
jgi:polysaccharide chain length determinant protein (PEP-CTERM system associated)